jgi:hypothetical protein
MVFVDRDFEKSISGNSPKPIPTAHPWMSAADVNQAGKSDGKGEVISWVRRKELPGQDQV